MNEFCVWRSLISDFYQIIFTRIVHSIYIGKTTQYFHRNSAPIISIKYNNNQFHIINLYNFIRFHLHSLGFNYEYLTFRSIKNIMNFHESFSKSFSEYCCGSVRRTWIKNKMLNIPQLWNVFTFSGWNIDFLIAFLYERKLPRDSGKTERKL